PAPLSPILRRQFHYDWHWFWETGDGELGNNGPHELDLCRWVAGYTQLPASVVSIGGRFGWEDRGQTPNSHIVYYDYRPAPLIVEIRNLPARRGERISDQYRGIRTGVVIECEGGYFAGMNGGGFYDPDGKRIRQVPGDGGRHHPANFISAVRSRRVSDLNCDIAEGHMSTALCHLGNISHRLGKPGRGNEIRQATRDQPDLADTYGRMASHLEANGLVLDDDRPILGPMLSLQPEAQRFVGPRADEANALCHRTYRAPFTLPRQA
ncbi:MAG: gfo/Idh/MocA family oxidoreductase, partial [Phycisphaerae bacterium]|nr:gfo/Idh/MocA family oxidoreductase [Phycisphaerae bacterium]